MSEEKVPTGPAGPTVLDIGGDTGALILHMQAEWLGREIEIEPSGEPGRRTHVAVLERRVAGKVAYAAVFPALTAGVHTVWPDDPERRRKVHIDGGAVAEVDPRQPS